MAVDNLPPIPDGFQMKSDSGGLPPIPDGFQLHNQDAIKVSDSSNVSLFSPEGRDYAAQHPIKTIFTPISKLLTGESIGERTDLLNKKGNELEKQSDLDVQKNLEMQKKSGKLPITTPKTPGMGEMFMNQLPAATEQAAVNAADVTPFDVATIGAVKGVSKIPVGSTTVGRIAENIAVKNPLTSAGRTEMGAATKELQGMESKLGNLDISGGKPIDTSSRGAYASNYDDTKNAAAIKAFTQAINPKQSKLNTTKNLEGYVDNSEKVMKTIVDNKDTLGITDAKTGELVNKLPETRSELNQSADKNMAHIWKQVSDLSGGATREGATIDYGSIAKKVIQPLLDSPQLKTHEPELVPKLKGVMDRIVNNGDITPTQAQEELKFLNDKLDAYFKKGDSQDQSLNMARAGLAYHLRNATDEAIDSTLASGGYKELRAKYGAFRNLKSDLVSGAANEMKGKGSSNALDPVIHAWSSGEILGGLVSHNPAMIAKGTAIGAVKGIFRKWSSPDFRIKQAFKVMENSRYDLETRAGAGTAFRQNIGKSQ